MNTKKKKRLYIAAAIVLVIAFLAAYTVWANTALETTEYKIKSENLPNAFNGFRVAQVSDLHNSEMGENNKKLLSALEKAKPDIIVITGDLIDSRRTNVDISLSFAKKSAEVAPCYYVTGNHESRVSQYTELKKGLKKAGVDVLENKSASIAKDGEEITILGVDDPSFRTDYLLGDLEQNVISSTLKELVKNDGTYKVLLSHRPEMFDTYVEAGIDLVFTGHAHGGQFRLPFLGGLIAPGQGFFPKYEAGVFTQNTTSMVVSRGIGNSIIPLRINNRPELVIVELEKA